MSKTCCDGDGEVEFGEVCSDCGKRNEDCAPVTDEAESPQEDDSPVTQNDSSSSTNIKEPEVPSVETRNTVSKETDILTPPENKREAMKDKAGFYSECSHFLLEWNEGASVFLSGAMSSFQFRIKPLNQDAMKATNFCFYLRLPGEDEFKKYDPRLHRLHSARTVNFNYRPKPSDMGVKQNVDLHFSYQIKDEEYCYDQQLMIDVHPQNEQCDKVLDNLTIKINDIKQEGHASDHQLDIFKGLDLNHGKTSVVDLLEKLKKAELWVPLAMYQGSSIKFSSETQTNIASEPLPEPDNKQNDVLENKSEESSIPCNNSNEVISSKNTEIIKERILIIKEKADDKKSDSYGKKLLAAVILIALIASAWYGLNKYYKKNGTAIMSQVGNNASRQKSINPLVTNISQSAKIFSKKKEKPIKISIKPVFIKTKGEGRILAIMPFKISPYMKTTNIGNIQITSQELEREFSNQLMNFLIKSKQFAFLSSSESKNMLDKKKALTANYLLTGIINGMNFSITKEYIEISGANVTTVAASLKFQFKMTAPKTGKVFIMEQISERLKDQDISREIPTSDRKNWYLYKDLLLKKAAIHTGNKILAEICPTKTEEIYRKQTIKEETTKPAYYPKATKPSYYPKRTKPVSQK